MVRRATITTTFSKMSFFEHTYIIALPHRHEATSRLMEMFPSATVVRAFHGRDLAAPKWFKAGAGAWGCYLSHVHVLMTAIHDGLESYLVLEDDAIFVPEWKENLALFEQHLPAHWGQAYLGGCHQAAPELINPFIYACHSVDRTHAFAVSKRAFRPMLSHLLETERYFVADRPRHIDQVLQQAHEKCLWPVFAPTWWIAGQKGGLSSISLDEQPDRWWHCPAYARALPFVLLATEPTDFISRHVFFGRKANERGEDWRLVDAARDRSKLAPFLTLLAQEALIYGKLPGLRTNELSRHDLEQMGFVVYMENDDLAALADYPRNNLINNGYYPKRTASTR